VSVFSAAIANRVKRIVHCSSMARYGALAPPFREDMSCKPQDPYGIGKLCVENMLRNLCEVHGTEFVIAVPHNIIGPRQKYDDPYRNVASIMINRALQGQPIIIYGDGEQQRCFSYIDDCLSCLKKLAFIPSLAGETINIGPDEQSISINGLAFGIKQLCGGNQWLEPIYMPGRPQEVKVALCSSDKARRLLGYKTTTTLEEGLAKMIEYIRRRGLKPFEYHLPIEIMSEKTPRTWTERLF
jgi:UDP-glucose 4-epimerase